MCPSLQGVEKHYGDSLPEIDPIEDMHVTEPEAIEAAQRLANLQARLKEHKSSMEAPVSSFSSSYLSCPVCWLTDASYARHKVNG